MGVYHDDSLDDVPVAGEEDRKHESFFEGPIQEEALAQEAVQDADEEDSDGSGTISSNDTASRISKRRRTRRSPARDRIPGMLTQMISCMRWNQ